MPPYDIVVDSQRHFVRATLRGFWDMATFASYMAGLKAAAANVARGGARNWWLIGIGAQVQAGDVAKAMGAELPGALPPNATVAVLMSSGLSAMQVRRVVSNDHHRHFLVLADAERWLAEQGMPA